MGGEDEDAEMCGGTGSGGSGGKHLENGGILQFSNELFIPGVCSFSPNYNLYFFSTHWRRGHQFHPSQNPISFIFMQFSAKKCSKTIG